MLHKYVQAPDALRFDIVFAVSNNRRSYRDTTYARTVLGFESQDSADSFA